MIPARRSLLVAVVAMVGLSACVSDPSPTQVAKDLVNTKATTPDERDCMLDVIDDYDLDDLGSDAESDNPEIFEPAQAELDQFEADLAACRE